MDAVKLASGFHCLCELPPIYTGLKDALEGKKERRLLAQVGLKQNLSVTKSPCFLLGMGCIERAMFTTFYEEPATPNGAAPLRPPKILAQGPTFAYKPPCEGCVLCSFPIRFYQLEVLLATGP